MQTLVRTGDMCTVSFLTSILEDAGIAVFVADTNINVMEGGIGAFPQRLMVHADDVAAARNIVSQAGLAHELEPNS